MVPLVVILTRRSKLILTMVPVAICKLAFNPLVLIVEFLSLPARSRRAKVDLRSIVAVGSSRVSCLLGALSLGSLCRGEYDMLGRRVRDLHHILI